MDIEWIFFEKVPIQNVFKENISVINSNIFTSYLKEMTLGILFFIKHIRLNIIKIYFINN